MKNLLVWLALGGLVAAAPYQPQVQQSQPPVQVELPSVPAPAEVPAELDLKSAIQVALRYQQSLRISQASVRSQQGRQEQVEANRRPRVSLSSSYSHPVYNSQADGFGAFLAAQGWNHNLNVSQLLYDFGHTNDLVRSQEEQVKGSQAALRQAEADLALQVKQAYYTVLQSQRLIAVQEDNLKNRREHIRQARTRFEAGLGLPSDVTRAETALSAALFQLSQAQTTASQQRVQLNLTLGLDPRVAVKLLDQEEQALDVTNVQQLFDLALTQRPELKQFQSNLASAQANLDAAHNQNAPSISTNLSYQNRQVPAVELIGLNLAINFTPYDGGARDGRVVEAEANRDRAQAELEAAQQRILSQVAQAYLNLKNSEQQVLAAQAEESNSRETLRLTDGRYRVGLGIFLDVLDAQSALLQAQTNRVNALTQVSLSRAALLRAMGSEAEATKP